jgi:hypothetical protein
MLFRNFCPSRAGLAEKKSISGQRGFGAKWQAEEQVSDGVLKQTMKHCRLPRERRTD